MGKVARSSYTLRESWMGKVARSSYTSRRSWLGKVARHVRNRMRKEDVHYAQRPSSHMSRYMEVRHGHWERLMGMLRWMLGI